MPKNNQVGIGAELSQVASYLYVIAPMKGSPADQAGVRAGDIIEYIDGKATRDISLYDAKQLLERCCWLGSETAHSACEYSPAHAGGKTRCISRSRSGSQNGSRPNWGFAN